MEILEYFKKLAESGGIWVVPSLILAMVLMQGVKAVIKKVGRNWDHDYRKWTLFVLAYLMGYTVGFQFIESPDRWKWAFLIGVINPVVYFGLVQYAVAKQKMVLLSILKMRPLKDDGSGVLNVDETQTFFVGKTKR